MSYENKKLGDLCTVKTGAPTGRAKNIPEGVEGHPIRVLLPRAMRDGIILDDELALETVGEVKEEDLTQLDDVIIKLSTPYDCVRIDEAHVGILITSFGMVLRRKEDVELNMQYLSMVLNSPQLNAVMTAASAGGSTTMAMLRKRTVVDLEIPVLPLSEQDSLAELSAAVRQRRESYQRLIELDRELESSQLIRAIEGR